METKNEQSTQIHKHDIFTIVEQNKIHEGKETKDFRVALGNAFVSEQVFDTLEQAQEYINTPTWEMIINTTCLIMQKIKENETK